MFNKIRALKQAYKTITSTKPKKISDATKKFKARIKATDEGLDTGIKEFKKDNPKNLVSDDQIKKIKKDKRQKYREEQIKDYLRESKKAGGRIGFKKGTGRSGVPAMDIKSTPTKKLSEKQKRIARLAGDPQKIDKPDFAKLRNKNKKKVI